MLITLRIQRWGLIVKTFFWLRIVIIEIAYNKRNYNTSPKCTTLLLIMIVTAWIIKSLEKNAFDNNYYNNSNYLLKIKTVIIKALNF